MKFLSYVITRLGKDNPNNLFEAISAVDPHQELWNVVDRNIDKLTTYLNDRLDQIGASPEQRTMIYHNIVNHMLRKGNVSINIPGLGNVKQLGTPGSPRTYSTDKPPFIKNEYRERIRKEYNDMIASGMSDADAISQLQTRWKGLEGRTLSTVLSGIRQKTGIPVKTPNPERVDMAQDIMNLEKEFILLMRDQKLSPLEAAKVVYKNFIAKHPTHKNPAFVVWTTLDTHASVNKSIKIPNYDQFKKLVQS